MKAKEWAERFRVAPELARAEYAGETLLLAARRGKSVGAIEAAVREQEQKFRALCKLVPELDPWDFDELMSEYQPRIYQTYLTAGAQRAKMLAMRRSMEEAAALNRKADAETDPDLKLAYRYAAILGRLFDQKEIEETYRIES